MNLINGDGDETTSCAESLHVRLTAIATSLSRNYTNALLRRTQIAAMPEVKHVEVFARSSIAQQELSSSFDGRPWPQ